MTGSRSSSRIHPIFDAAPRRLAQTARCKNRDRPLLGVDKFDSYLFGELSPIGTTIGGVD